MKYSHDFLCCFLHTASWKKNITKFNTSPKQAHTKASRDGGTTTRMAMHTHN